MEGRLQLARLVLAIMRGVSGRELHTNCLGFFALYVNLEVVTEMQSDDAYSS